MKTRSALLVLAALAFGCGDASSPEDESLSGASAALTAATTSSTPWQPYSVQGYSACQNETYTFAGQTMTRTRVTSDQSGGLHVTTLQFVRGTAVGDSTGAQYVTSEGGLTAENYLSSGATSFDATFKGTLITKSNNVPDTRYTLLVHLTINADGTVTSNISSFEIDCP